MQGKLFFRPIPLAALLKPRINQQQTESISAKRGVGVEFQCVSAWQTVCRHGCLAGTQAHVPTHKHT